MDFIFLSDAFYEKHSQHTEIEQKRDRPYIMVCIRINGRLFAAPLRSNINHPHALYTDKANRCGVDFSKAVVLLHVSDVDHSRSPHIRQNEFDFLRGKEHLVAQKMLQYIAAYKKAKRRLDVPRNATLCQYSTLQYFERYI